jgi:hypothetical protein
MKGFLYIGILLAAIIVVVINPSLVADQVLNWAKQNPQNQYTPEVLFDTARACQLLTDGDTAIKLYNYLYQQYPEKADLCAPAMYYCGEIKEEAGYIKVIRMEAVPYLQIVLDQYPDQMKWVVKARQLMSEVNGEFH